MLLWITIMVAFAPSHAKSEELVKEQTGELGEWKTFDDKTGLPRGVVRITVRDGVLTGTIVQAFNARSAVRGKCEDDRKGKPIVGLEVLWGARASSDGWTGGMLLDPEDGRVYHCTIKLNEDGSQLLVRGYVGTPLLGRTQTWRRVPKST